MLYQTYYMETLSTSYSTSTPMGFTNPLSAKKGKQLRIMADNFFNSLGKIRNAAQDSHGLSDGGTADAKLVQFIGKLFTTNKIIAEKNAFLLIYCSDIVLLLLRRKANSYFRQTLEWTLKLIAHRAFLLLQKCGQYTQDCVT